jgi:hypothetical protein
MDLQLRIPAGKSTVMLAVILGLGTLSFWLWHGRHPALGDLAQPDPSPKPQAAPAPPPTSAP